jgi:hypothetical protein
MYKRHARNSIHLEEKEIMGSKRAVNLLRRSMRPVMKANVQELTSNTISSNYIRFATEDWDGMTVSVLNAAETEAGPSMVDGYIYESAAIGTETAALTLPAAAQGALTVFRFTGQYDDDDVLSFTCASGDFLAAGTINLNVSNISAGQVITKRAIQTSWTQATNSHSGLRTMDGTTHNKISFTGVATNNQTNKDAELAFYCAVDGFWRIAWRGSQLGSGAFTSTHLAISAV